MVGLYPQYCAGRTILLGLGWLDGDWKTDHQKNKGTLYTIEPVMESLLQVTPSTPILSAVIALCVRCLFRESFSTWSWGQGKQMGRVRTVVKTQHSHNSILDGVNKTITLHQLPRNSMPIRNKALNFVGTYRGNAPSMGLKLFFPKIKYCRLQKKQEKIILEWCNTIVQKLFFLVLDSSKSKSVC